MFTYFGSLYEHGGPSWGIKKEHDIDTNTQKNTVLNSNGKTSQECGKGAYQVLSAASPHRFHNFVFDHEDDSADDNRTQRSFWNVREVWCKEGERKQNHYP